VHAASMMWPGSEAARPHLVAMYVSIVDKAGHERGPAAPVAGQVDLVVVADHGMMDVAGDHVVDLSRWISLDGVRTADPGPVLALWFGADTARRDSAYAALATGLAAGGAHAAVYRRGETPERWHLRAHPRAGDLLVAAEPGWIVMPAPPKTPWVAGSTAGIRRPRRRWAPSSSPRAPTCGHAG